MSSQPPHPPPRTGGGLSLYANLLDPPKDDSAATSISRAPVVSQEALDAMKEGGGGDAAANGRKLADPALRFQPQPQIRRPQQKTQKPKVAFPKAAPAQHPPPPPPPPSSGGNADNAAAPPPPPPVAKSGLADWAPTEEDEYMYGMGEKRARGGRRGKKRKNKEDNTGRAAAETDWDEIYDPSRPTNVEEYLRSDEKIREMREWRALLYRHRRRTPPDEEERRATAGSEGSDGEREDEDADDARRRGLGNQFAPPDSYSFAPPPMSPPRAAASVPDDKTGDDAYARRLALSQGQPPPPPPPLAQSATDNTSYPPPPPPQPPKPEEADSATISRAPVRYARPEPSADADAMDEDDDYTPPEALGAQRGEEQRAGEEDEEGQQPRSNRPGKKGFAARLMSKYGWEKGQGLGADSSGIVQPLRVQVEKRKKRSDAEGGGWAEPGGRGRIIASKTGTPSGGDGNGGGGGGKFGPVSDVVVLRDMLEGMPDLQAEMEAGLAQEIGEECGDRYGRVERLKIDVEGRRVYIKFTDQVSALRAVNALEGRVFAGNTIVPQFYDAEKFEKMIYE